MPSFLMAARRTWSSRTSLSRTIIPTSFAYRPKKRQPAALESSRSGELCISLRSVFPLALLTFKSSRCFQVLRCSERNQRSHKGKHGANIRSSSNSWHYAAKPHGRFADV